MVEDIPVLAAIDLGSTRFRAVVAEPDGRGGVTVLGHASLPAQGLTRSNISDLPAAADAIARVLERARREAEIPPDFLAVSVNGDHVRSLSAHSCIPLENGGKVRARHLEVAQMRAQSMGIPFDQVILHCLPVEYTLDAQRGLTNPLGMIGSRLELDAHVVTGSQAAVGSLDRALQMAGTKPDLLVFGACATSWAVVTDAERENGCLLIDIGGEVTHYALFKRGRLRQSGVVPLGGNFVTRDLAYGLSVDLDVAERSKRAFGVALRCRAITGPVRGDAPPPELRAEIAAICEARQQEILEMVGQGLQWGVMRPTLQSGVILTGGGARLAATAELVEQVFSLRAVERRVARDDQGDEPDSWATAVGLVKFTVDCDRAAPGKAHEAVGGGLVRNVKRWFERIT
jgi:cell division protein FtsA